MIDLKKKISGVNKIYIAVVIYALFALSRIKTIGMPRLGGTTLSNMTLIALVAVVMIALLNGRRSFKIHLQKVFFMATLLIVAMFSLSNPESRYQSLYAVAIMFVPMAFLLFPANQSKKEFLFILKVFNFLALVYAIITIFSSLNYGYVMDLIGNKGSDYGDQVRAVLPLGSSITVCYYLNMTLPISLYFFTASEKKGGKIYALVCVIANILATLIQLSRSATVTAVVIVIFYLLFMRSRRGRLSKLIFLALVVVAVIYMFDTVDLERLTIGFFGSDSKFDFSRLRAGNLGISLFLSAPLFGVGAGRYFHRAWSGSNLLIVDGVSGLVDPHNAYLLLLSETGVVGSLLYIIFMVMSLKEIVGIKDMWVRRTAYMIILSLLINSVAGSHLINEASFSCIAFIYLAVFIGRAKGQKVYNE